MSQSHKHIALWLVLALVFLVIFSVFSKQHGREPEIVFSDFMSAVDRGDIQEVVIQGHNIQGKYKNGERFRTFAPTDPDLVKSLRERKVKIAAKPEEDSPWYMVFLLNWFPMLLLIGVWVFFMRQMQVGGGKAMSFGKSRAKLLTENQHRVTFADVAGADEAKDDLQEIIAFLKDPKKFTKLGYTAFTAEDGAEAIEQAFSNLPDIIILDVKLPKLSGIEVCKRLKADARTKNIPILILSAKAQSNEIREGLEAGADKYLCKPISFPDLLREVRAYERSPTQEA